jgi:peroxiredoxin
VAEALSTYEPNTADARIGVVISTSSRQAGDDFVERHSLSRFPHLVDEGGVWVTENFGVKMSPSALLMEKGVLVEAYTFTKIPALVGHIAKAREGVS